MVDGTNAVGAEKIRQRALHRTTVGQHIADTAGHAQIILKHNKLAVLKPQQICSRDCDIDIAWHLQPTHLAPEMAAGVNHLAWNHSVAENFPFMIHVVQKEIERSNALHQALLNMPPLSAGDQPRQQVIGKMRSVPSSRP